MSTGKTPDLFMRVLWQSHQQTYLVANQVELGELSHSDDLCSCFEVVFTCCKILRHVANGFTSPPKEGVLQILITLKSSSPLLGLNHYIYSFQVRTINCLY
jgi:hypothetical protein